MDTSVKIVLSAVGAGAVSGAIKSIASEADRSYRILQRRQDEVKSKYRTLADSVSWFGRRAQSATDMTIRRMAVLRRQVEGVRAEMRKLAMQDLQSRWTDLVAAGGSLMAARGVVAAQARSEAALRDIAITVGVARTTDEARLGSIVEQTARQTRLSLEEVRTGMARLAAGGVSDVAEFGRMMPEVARAAKAWRATTEDMAALALVARDTLGIADARRAFNIVGTGGKLGEFEIPDMTRYLPSLAPQLAAIGLRGEKGLAQGVGYLQASRRGAGTAEEAATNFANFLAKVTSREFADRWKDLTGRNLAHDQARLVAKGYDAVGATLKLIETYMKRQGKGELMTKLAKGTDADAQAAIAELQQAHGLGELFTDMQAAKFIRAALMYRELQQKVTREALQGNPLDEDFAHAIDTTESATKRLAVAWEGLTSRIGRAIKPVTDALLGAGAVTLEWVSGLMDAFPRATQVLVTLGAAAAGYFTAMRAFSVASAAARVMGLSLSFGKVTMAVTLLKTAVGRATAALGSMAAGALARVISMGGVLAAGGSKLAVMAGAVGSAIASAAGVAGRAILWLGRAVLLNPIGLTLTAIAGAAYLVWRNWETIGPKLAAVWGTVKGAFSSAWQWISAMPGQMLAIGRQIIDGLLAGMRERWAALKEGVSNIGSNIADWFKDKLGIRSPSRVFAELGGHLMGGLQLGIERSSGRPLAAMRTVASALAVPMAAGALAVPMAAGALAVPMAAGAMALGSAGAATAGGMPAAPIQITVNLNGPASPEAAQDVAAAVRREVERALAEAGRREQLARRAALIDGGMA
ncbi:phage tail tape measure protein [Tepidimonas charontis]|nr:phage tail tape measure protein [Tepidimonas charontis]